MPECVCKCFYKYWTCFGLTVYFYWHLQFPQFILKDVYPPLNYLNTTAVVGRSAWFFTLAPCCCSIDAMLTCVSFKYCSDLVLFEQRQGNECHQFTLKIIISELWLYLTVHWLHLQRYLKRHVCTHATRLMTDTLTARWENWTPPQFPT